jgi:hypothetical protein
MEKHNMILAVVVIAIAIASVYVLYPKPTQVEPGKYDDFATCLTESSVIMYGTDWCPKCIEQKELFGTSFNLVDYFNCDYDKVACRTAGVSGYPTWKINGQLYPGKRSLEELSALSGCELE